MRKAPFLYYGAKGTMAEAIVAEFPVHKRYVENFVGSGAAFYHTPNWREVKERILSDLNYWALNIHAVIQSAPNELIRALPARISREDNLEYRNAIKADERSGHPVTDAAAAIAVYHSNFNASPWSDGFSKKMADQFERAMENGSMQQRIEFAHAKLQGVQLQRADALEMLDRYASVDTLFFCDPPYMFAEHRGGTSGGSRGAAYGGYGKNEPVSNEWHEDFLDACEAALKNGADLVVTSGNDKLYKDRLTAMGLRFAGAHGRKGKGKDKGGTGTAKNLLWTTQPTAEQATLF